MGKEDLLNCSYHLPVLWKICPVSHSRDCATLSCKPFVRLQLSVPTALWPSPHFLPSLPSPALLHCPSPSSPANLPAITKPGNIHLMLSSRVSRPNIQTCFPLSLRITVTPFYSLDSSFSGPLLAACCLLLFAYPEVNLSEALAAAFLRSARSQVLWQCLINHLSFRQRVMRLHTCPF